MDLKEEAARAAFALIPDNRSVGLGEGRTIRWLVDFLQEGIKNGLRVKLYTSSFDTQKYLLKAGMRVFDFSQTDVLDFYFDGCDQIDLRLNAFKSGAGIHTTEKILASMAKKCIILGDESKLVSKLDNQYPLVLEVLPQSVGHVYHQLNIIFGEPQLYMRKLEGSDLPVQTRNGNYLIDCRFTELPEPEFIQTQTKKITGVVEISLFYQLVSQAIIAGPDGIRHLS